MAGLTLLTLLTGGCESDYSPYSEYYYPELSARGPTPLPGQYGPATSLKPGILGADTGQLALASAPVK